MMNNNPYGIYWVTDALGGMPFQDFDSLRAIKNIQTVDAIVSLLQHPEEELDLYQKKAAEAEIELFNCPLTDGSVPNEKELDQIIQFIDRQLKEKKTVVVHCKAGRGRTGTIIAAWLIRKGDTFEQAVKTVRTANPLTIESEEQMEFLRNLR